MSRNASAGSAAAPAPAERPKTRAPRLWTAPWRDRAGRFCGLRCGVFLLVAAPGLWLAALLATGQAGAKPTETALDLTGVWAVRFLLLSLAVSPARRIFRWSRALRVRRMLGLAAAAYAGLHLAAYAIDQGGDLARVASEIALRFYLTIGFIALAGLAALAATSTDRWIRRLGPRWTTLHQLSYPIAALALWHFLLQSKLDAAEATVMVGLFALLMAYRALTAINVALTPAALAAAALAAVPVTMAFELLWYASATSLPVERVWAANFDVAYGAIRPGWIVGLAGLAVSLAAFAVARLGRTARAREAPRPALSRGGRA